MINGGKCGNLIFFSDQYSHFFQTVSLTTKMTAPKIYLFNFNLENVVEALGDCLFILQSLFRLSFVSIV